VFDENRKYWASAKFNGAMFVLSTHSGFRRTVRDPAGGLHILPSVATDSALGAAVRDALSKSRILATEVERLPLYELTALKRNYEAWVDSLLAKSVKKSRSALFQKMADCSLELENNILSITPSKHEKLEAWGGDSSHLEAMLKIAIGSTDNELGAALREAFRRCTGNVADVPDAPLD
jgi:CDI immunity protein